jgi:hypothetical protein
MNLAQDLTQTLYGEWNEYLLNQFNDVRILNHVYKQKISAVA